MDNEKKTQDALLEAIDIMIENKLKKLNFNYYVDGVIQAKNSNNTYNVLINNTLYKNIPSKNGFEYLVNDTVQILVKNGNWNKKVIDDKIGHNKAPQNLLNLGTRIRIYGNSDFNDYKAVGSYAVCGNTDAETISNMPYQMAGVLDVYLSNGDNVYDDGSYIYLIQEYTILNGAKRYYRHISKSGNNADWVYGEWLEVLTTSVVQDYIVEQGTNGIWTYRKWNSGKAECWGTYVLDTAVNTPWGSMYVGDVKSGKIQYPFIFATRPVEIANVNSSHNAVWIFCESGGVGNNTQSSGSYNVCRTTAVDSSQSFSIHLYVIGRWK